jgi:hypothetical protein
MSDLKFTEAFEKYGAKLSNPQWAFSALAGDGSLVISCWQHKITIPEKGLMRYTDALSRFRLHTPGKNLLTTHLGQAYQEKLPVRLVIVSAKDTGPVDAGEDVSGLAKTFHIRKDYVGSVVSFDGDAFVIDFRKEEGGK